MLRSVLVDAGDDFLIEFAANKFSGDKETAAQRILKEFRTGVLGEFALELPPIAAPSPDDLDAADPSQHRDEPQL